jgi:capsular exopolysaccharide synthesis family protein
MKKELITAKEPKSPISELFRTLRTNIQFMNSKNRLKSLLVTSASPAEGKSWVSSNLATTFAQAGKKVILVDSDMRKGRLFTIFGVTPTPGLSNYLSGVNSNGEYNDDDIVKYIRQTEVDNLYLIPAGSVPPNPSELLVSEKMANLMEKLESICDVVIYDGTPTTLVTDALILSRNVDTTIIVCAHNQTKIDDLERIKRDILNVGGKIAGVVINKMPISQKEYYSSYYYGQTNTVTRRSSRTNHNSNNNMNFEQRIRPNGQSNRIFDVEKDRTVGADADIDIKETTKSSLDVLNEMNSYLEEQKRSLNGDNK